MDIKNRTILVLGGWGLVGSAVCHKLMKHEPARLIVTSLKESEARDAVEQLRREYPDKPADMFVPHWGNVFIREEWKDMPREQILSDDAGRLGLVEDIIDELTDDVLNRSALYRLIVDEKPDAVIDCINTATAIAYQDIYASSRAILYELHRDTLSRASVERLLASLYTPQLIRHVQIMYRALKDASSTMYIKIGTSGTGGMGLNIPYTHSEERPSRVLLSKSSVAGAHTLLLFLMARTPDGPIVKEIKPTGAIAWKKIAYGDVIRRGRPIPLVDMPFEKALAAAGTFLLDTIDAVEQTGENFKAPFIDTGENGIFSLGEFEAISAAGQMELVTPEEIAESVVFEMRGGNSGHDVIQALDSSAMEPTYRAGYLRDVAVRKLVQLEQEHDSDSVAFEMLGPPRLSKLLYEAHLLKLIAGTPDDVIKAAPEELSAAAEALLKTNRQLRSQMLSIGLVVLLSDGKNYLRGNDVKIPPFRGDRELPLTPANLEQWAEEGWVDLRPATMKAWQERFERILRETNALPGDDTSSRFIFTRQYWNNFESIAPGKIAAWIFDVEEKGTRMKD